VNGRNLTLGALAGLAVAGMAAQRGSRKEIEGAWVPLRTGSFSTEDRHVRPYAFREAMQGEVVATLSDGLVIRMDMDRLCNVPTALLYDGDDNVGYVQLARVSGPGDENLKVGECDSDIRLLAKRLKTFGHPSVTYWMVWRSELRSAYMERGLGVKMYEAALRFVHEQFNKPAIFFPEMCMEEGTTSIYAERVWGSLWRRWESEGWAVSSIPLALAGIAGKRGSRAVPLPDNPARDAAFQTLAHGQRGEPEDAMLRLQHAQIAQEYGWLCEHVGDLTHRMSEHGGSYSGGAIEKIVKTLHALQPRSSVLYDADFERDIRRQIASNVAYHAEPERVAQRKPWMVSIQSATEKLATLGRAYADAHEKLRVYNRVQDWARKAAVAVGHQDFERARLYLGMLELEANKGREHWRAVTMEFDPAYDDASISRAPDRRRGVARSPRDRNRNPG